jgi:serine/threonine-protein kinase
MALASGSRIGSYEIIAPLGAGGMGQVYRARDTQLGRDVAIKALPDLLASDPERVARFQREAQVLAALNHPNIAGIHGVQEDGKAKYLVLEFVEGVTLADHIAKAGASGLALPDALPIARQVIDALEAAHDKGIVHRDLKPANIMIGADGQAKVLDFGLARVVEPDPTASATNSPTFTMAATQAGVILGTAAYMSPEQAKGRVADKRSDVWAFGCVLYEMLTGKRVFGGEDISETIAAVLRADPEWGALPSTTPAGIRTLLERCLQRDRKMRIPDMAVVRYLVDEAMSPSAAARAQRPARPLWMGLAFAGGVVLTAVGAWAVAAWTPEPAPAQPVRFGITPPVSQRLAPTPADRQVAISPDGQFLVYVSGGASTGGQLMLRSLNSLEAAPIAGATSARHPFFSPDGKWIGYFGTTDLRKVDIRGGSSVTICAVDGPPRGATWLPDDTIIFATAQPSSGLLSVSAAGGAPRALTTPAQGEGDHVYPSALPDGRGVLFTVVPTSLQPAGANIAVLDVATGTQTVVIRGGSGAQYVEPGYVLYAAGSAVNGVRFDAARRQVLGDAQPILNEAAVVLSGVPQFTASTTGALVYVPSAVLAATTGGGSERTIVLIDRRGGKEEPLKVPPRAYFALRLSPDNTRLALDVRDQDNDVWIWDLARRTLTRFSFDPGADLFPVWTHDSRRIIWSTSPSGSFNLHIQAADGTGAPQRLTTAPHAQYALSTTADDRVLILELKAAQNADVGVLPLAGNGSLTPLLQSPATERGAEVSPDGRFVVYSSDESSTSEIYVRPFPNVNEGKWQISTAGGSKPMWSPTGRELFYIDANNQLQAVPVQTTPVFRPGNPTRLFEARNIATLASGRFYDVTRDGQKFVMIKELPPPPGQPTTPAGPSFVVVLNWPEELRTKFGK